MNSTLSNAAIATLLSLILFSSECHAASSCIQNTISGVYESADKTNSKTCAITESFLPNEQFTTTNQVKIQPKEIFTDSEITTTDIEEKPTATTWDLRVEDGSVYAALKRWSAISGWQVSWEIPVDFPIEISDSSTGSFENSVRRVLTAFQVSDYPPYPCFHENNVVRVVRRIQGNDDECK